MKDWKFSTHISHKTCYYLGYLLHSQIFLFGTFFDNDRTWECLDCQEYEFISADNIETWGILQILNVTYLVSLSSAKEGRGEQKTLLSTLKLQVPAKHQEQHDFEGNIPDFSNCSTIEWLLCSLSQGGGGSYVFPLLWFIISQSPTMQSMLAVFCLQI